MQSVFVCGYFNGRRVGGAVLASAEQEENAYAEEGSDGDADAETDAQGGGV
jgi:hypothetical protein